MNNTNDVPSAASEAACTPAARAAAACPAAAAATTREELEQLRGTIEPPLLTAIAAKEAEWKAAHDAANALAHELQEMRAQLSGFMSKAERRLMVLDREGAR